jgi:PAS domain S-box-containing protein
VSKGSEARSVPTDSPKPLRPSIAKSHAKMEIGAVRRFVIRIANPLDRKRFQRALVLMVGLPFLLMTVTAATLLWAIRGLVTANQAVQHTGQVIAQSFEALNLALEMDTTQQRYLESADQLLLQRYRQTSASVDAALAKLETLVRDQESELRQLNAIKASLAQWRSIVEEAIEKGPEESSAYNAREEALMEHIRTEFSRLVSAEQELRASYLASSRDAIRFTSRLGILLTLAVGFIIAVFAAYQLLAISRVYERALSRADRLSEELAEREAHFRILAEAIPQMVWATSPDGTPEYFNQRWLDYIGAARQSREPWLQRVSPEDSAAANSAWRASLASGKAFTIELRLRGVADSYRWHLGLALPLRDERGAVVRWLGTFTDIADQKRAEEALTRMAAIVETSEDGIYSKDLEGHINSWNRGAEKMFGYSANEMIGQPVSTLSPPERRREADDLLELLRRGQSIDHFETVRLRKDGSSVEVSVSISPIRNSTGAVTGASTIARDISERNRAAEALRKTEKLAATGRLAGTMAHEINNPLEAVTNLLYLINRNSSLDQKAHEYAQMAISEVDRIGHIAREALGFYREAATPVDVNISDLVGSIVRLYAAGAQNKSVHLETQLETQATVPAFPGEMRQVFSNLIVNAVDAVPRGGIIHIRVKHGRNWKSRAMGIRVLVSDNGPGIPMASRPHIFEPFFTTKGEKGTGVGLWVSQGVIEKHSGSIRMKTSTGAAHGTTFSVFLPYA